MKIILWFGFVFCALSAAGKVFFAEVGNKGVLTCGAESYSSYLVWYKGSDRIIKIDERSGLPQKGSSDIYSRSKVRITSLEISRVIESDAGEFKCEADRKASQHTLVVVSVSAVPSKDVEVGSEVTLRCQVNGVDQSSTVKWLKPDGSAISEQTHKLKPIATSDAGTWQCVVTHKEATHTAKLTLTVKEVLFQPGPKITTPSKSPSNSSQSERNNTSQVDVKYLGLTWWMWAALGAGCLVLILLIICIIIMCKKVKRKKRKVQRMKQAQQLRPDKFCQCGRSAAAAKPQQGRRREKPSALPLQPLLTQ